jgi:hypothetical protein
MGNQEAAMRLPAALVVASMLAPAARTEAAMMVHHDLASLVMLGDAVVMAERGKARDVTPYVSATTYAITKVYAGKLAAGTSLEVLDDAYDETFDPGYGPGDAKPDPTVVLFIRKVDPASLAPGLENGPGWSVVPSGMRVMFSGRVYRFEQLSNPGLYRPVPQGRDPYDVRDELPVAEAVDLATFEEDLGRALERVVRYREALGQKNGSERSAKLLAVLDEPDPIPLMYAERYGLGGFYEDALGQEIIGLFHEEGDTKNLLEAVARTGRPGARLFLQGLDAEKLVSYAEAEGNPERLRLAALMLVAWRMLWKEDGHMKRIVGLVGDGSPRVAEAATLIMRRSLHTTFYDAKSKPKVAGKKHRKLIVEALVEAYADAADPFLRVAIVRAAAEFGFAKKLAKMGPGPIVELAAERRAGYVCYAYAFVSKPGLFLSGIAAVTQKGKRIGLEVVQGSSGSSHGSGLAKSAKAGKAIPAGVTIEALFEGPKKGATHEARTPLA